MRRAAAAAIVALLSSSAIASVLECTVRSVHDGDTLTADCAGAIHKIRLVEIDAPERTQPYSRISTNALKALCLHKSAKIESKSQDKYGRTLGRVHCAGVDANAEQVRTGMAWAFDKYLTDPAIKALERDARAAKIGLWRGANPVPPWEFRHNK